ncbi:hypothetical protein AAKU61_003649 [Undibacterium sp. GrIS 1.2]|uniref:hypothetical protein n=1 Tax=Undibacterium sp. GrIS 1.2 TaxID=3143933 RepID=UPI0033916E90
MTADDVLRCTATKVATRHRQSVCLHVPRAPREHRATALTRPDSLRHRMSQIVSRKGTRSARTVEPLNDQR